MSDQVPSTDTSNSSELKAGHAPATKVGGMRVSAPRPRHPSHGEGKKAADNTEVSQESSGDNTAESGANNEATDANENDEEPTRTVSTHVAGEMVSGTFVPIEKGYPTEGVKHIHDKPGTHPKHEFHAHSKHQDQRFLNQPRKQ